jgi:hypothetical protein
VAATSDVTGPKILTMPKLVKPKPTLPTPVVTQPKEEVSTTASTTTSLSMPFDVTLYRGEKQRWWPEPKKRLISGMTLWAPWKVKPYAMTDLWEKLRTDIQEQSIGNVKSYAQYLRATSRNFALATARSTVGSFSSDYNFTLEFKNVRTFYWGPKLSLGKPANFKSTLDIDADYIVLNADAVADSTILAFGHKTATGEVTFVHDLPISCVLTCNGKKVDELGILKLEDLSISEKADLNKLLRP